MRRLLVEKVEPIREPRRRESAPLSLAIGVDATDNRVLRYQAMIEQAFNSPADGRTDDRLHPRAAFGLVALCSFSIWMALSLLLF